MITLYQVRDAMTLINHRRDKYALEVGIIKQLALSLEIYLDRGEYHHDNLKEAVECLELAGYEIKK